jgi:NleD-like pathogen effector protein (putative zinc metallopeptidase)
MLQFEPYPIYIVHSLHRQQAVDPLWKDYYGQREAAKKRAVGDLFSLHWSKVKRDIEVAREKDRMIDATMQWQIQDDLSKYKKEKEAYENNIKSALTKISHTSIGKQLLEMIGSSQKVYVIPQEFDGPATTRLATEEQGGGIRVMFSPQYFSNVFVGPRSVGNAVEDTLFHELVHAMRIARGRYFVRNLSSWDFRHSSEEFIAETFANIYHSSRGESDYYGTYQGSFMRKKEMYAYLEDDLELVRALKFYLETEQLAKFAANLQQPDYNPFRDYKEIEERSYVRYFPDDAESNPFYNK